MRKDNVGGRSWERMWKKDVEGEFRRKKLEKDVDGRCGRRM